MTNNEFQWWPRNWEGIGAPHWGRRGSERCQKLAIVWPWDPGGCTQNASQALLALYLWIFGQVPLCKAARIWFIINIRYLKFHPFFLLSVGNSCFIYEHSFSSMLTKLSVQVTAPVYHTGRQFRNFKYVTSSVPSKQQCQNKRD